jgi:hypothetical protein
LQEEELVLLVQQTCNIICLVFSVEDWVAQVVVEQLQQRAVQVAMAFAAVAVVAVVGVKTVFLLVLEVVAGMATLQFGR